jgi:hypothetical protein
VPIRSTYAQTIGQDRLPGRGQSSFNINTHKFESLIHGFLGKQRLNITLLGLDGQTYHPREWFHAPLATVLSVIKYILDSTISQYRMDNTTGKIVAKRDTGHS